MTVNKKFGTKLRELRKDAGLTLRELADSVGVNFSYLSKIENGVLPPPSERVIERLARVLNFDKDELLSLAGIIPPDIAEILKDRKAREKLRAEQARKEAKMAHHESKVLPKVKPPWKGLYRMALPVFLVLAVALSIWFASPTQALTIDYPSQPGSGTLGSTYTFYVRVNIQDYELLPLESIDVVIYNTISPTTYVATLETMPLGTSSTATHNPSEGSGSGTATVAATADAAWGYTASGTGYAYFGSTGYNFITSPTGGYGYQGGYGTTSIIYTVVWTPPSGWLAGTYQIRTVLTTSPQSPGGGTTFTQTSSTFTLATPVYSPGGGSSGTIGGTTYLSDFVTQTGRFIQDVTASSADNNVKLTIKKDTIGKQEFGQPLYVIRITPVTPPFPPPGNNIIGLAYNFVPSGVTFDPAATLTFTYNPANLPAGADEAHLSPAYYDITAGAWVVLEGAVVDTTTHTISVPVSHFTTFAVLAGMRPAAFTVSGLGISPASMDLGDTATVTATIANTGDLSGSFDAVLRINNGITETKTVTLAGGSSGDITFTVAPNVPGTYKISIDGLDATLEVAAPVTTTTSTTTTPPPTSSTTLTTTTSTPTTSTTTAPPTTSTTVPPPTKAGINWWLIAGIVAVVIIVGILTWQMVPRRVK